MKVGFTGTQDGMTQAQRDELYRRLSSYDSHDEFHHGDCIGADAEADDLAQAHDLRIEVHPPTNATKRAFRRGDYTHEPKPYLVRNKAIVDATDFLIACPKSKKEKLRSGTWSTIRYARKKRKRIVIIYPSGETWEKH